MGKYLITQDLRAVLETEDRSVVIENNNHSKMC